jgi:hypothetical protein
VAKIERHIAVARIGRHGDICIACAQVDRLSPGDDDRGPMRLERSKRIEQRASGLNVDGIDARRRRFVSSLAHAAPA